ncbi:flagellin [Mobiluncus mulieris]|uniref:flagellin N-terminal helical domain-containing protein n=1 Tax=Mobiluncus mulieris TaxID=2052 RepID=UPI0024B61E1D|nr:flagellin [Mobiluncus mulieris]
MSLSINQNIMAMNSYRNLSVTQGGLAKSLEKLSSGFRINRAADDAAGLAISEGLRSQVGGNRQAVRNAQDGISLVQTAEGALNEVHSILQRMRVLAVQGATDSNSSEARNNINTELNQLREELERIGKVTNFNGTQLLDGSASEQKALKFQVGANGDSNNRITVDLKDADVTAISQFHVDRGISNVVTVEGTIAKDKTYTLDMEGKKVTFTGGADADANKAAIQEALTKAGVSGYVKDGKAKVESSKFELNTSKTLEGKTFTLEIDGKSFTTEKLTADSTAENAAQTLNEMISKSTLAGQYEVTQKGGKFTVEAKGEAKNKYVDVKLSTDAEVKPTGKKPAVANPVLYEGKIGVNSGGDFEFEVTDTLIKFKRTDGKTINVDLAHAMSEHVPGAAAGNPDQAGKLVDLTAKNAAGVAIDGTAGKEWYQTKNMNALTVRDHDSAQNLIRVLDQKIQSVSTARSNLGAVQNRFEHTITNLNVAVENLAASESRVRDTDMAQEMMQFTRNQILSQAGTSMLAQANQVPQGVLSLLR